MDLSEYRQKKEINTRNLKQNSIFPGSIDRRKSGKLHRTHEFVMRHIIKRKISKLPFRDY